MKTIPLYLSFVILFFSCRSDNEFDKSKRNDKWVWWIDDKNGKGEWVPINGDAPVVENGKYTRYYYDGNIFETGRLKNGKHIDTTFYYDREGKQYGYILNENDTERIYYYKDGQHKFYASDGKKESEGIIVNHREGNEWTDYFSNGKVYRELKTINGVGWEKIYYENGNPKMLTYGDKIRRIYITTNEWYENGQKKLEINVTNGIVDGPMYKFHPNGNIETEGFYKNDKRNGVFKTFYESGKLKGVQTIKDDVLNDTAKEWYESGQLKTIGFFKNGKPEGRLLKYHENGKIWKVSNYKNGLAHGMAELFDSSGKLQERENYIAGKRVN